MQNAARPSHKTGRFRRNPALQDTPTQPAAGGARPSSSNTVIVVAAIVVVAVLSALARRDGGPKVREISGTVVAVDTVTGRAEADVLHPRSGQKLRVSGAVSKECTITINGRPAALADVRPGDEFEAEASIDADRKLTANWIHITRTDEAMAPPPATQPVGKPS